MKYKYYMNINDLMCVLKITKPWYISANKWERDHLYLLENLPNLKVSREDKNTFVITMYFDKKHFDIARDAYIGNYDINGEEFK